VGAHEGEILQEIVRVSPRGRHIAYEPVAASYERLARRFPEVDVRRAALWSETGETMFTHVRSRPGYSGVRMTVDPAAEAVETITVRAETLDASLPAGYVPALIKIDVEGAEAHVIEGGLATIRAHRPMLIFEHGAAARAYDTRPERIYDAVAAEAGLRLFDLDGQAPYDRARFVEMVERGTYWNFVAHA